MRYASNITATDVEVPSGIHGMSNHLLDTPWPKVRRAIELFTPIVQEQEPSIDALFELLLDGRQAPDSALPSTGVELKWERALSSIFIRTPDYGTRCSTVITLDSTGRVRFEERSQLTGGRAAFDFSVSR